MTNPLAQVEVEAEIMRLSEKAEQVTQEIGKRARAAAEADAAYDAAYYRAFLLAEGAMELRKAIAKDKTADLYLQKVAAEAVLDSAKEAGRNTRAQLDALRSINANHRALVS